MGEDTDVLNNLLSNLKTGRVQRQSMKRVLPKDPTLQLAPIELLKIEKQTQLQETKNTNGPSRAPKPINLVKQTPVLVIPNSQAATLNSPLPTTPSTVKFRRNLYNFSENRE